MRHACRPIRMFSLPPLFPFSHISLFQNSLFLTLYYLLSEVLVSDMKTIAPLRCWNCAEDSAGLPPHETSFEMLVLKTWSIKMTHILLSSPYKVTSSTHIHRQQSNQTYLADSRRSTIRKCSPKKLFPQTQRTGIPTRINLC